MKDWTNWDDPFPEKEVDLKPKELHEIYCPKCNKLICAYFSNKKKWYYSCSKCGFNAFEDELHKEDLSLW